MFNSVENLQKKSESHRKKVALIFSIVFILVIIALWLIFLFSGAKDNFGLNKEEGEVNIEDVSSPIESLRNSLGSSLKSFEGLFEGEVEPQ